MHESVGAQVRAAGLAVQGADFAFTPSSLGFDPSKGIAQPIPEKPAWPDDVREAFRTQAPFVANSAPANIAEPVDEGIAEARKAFGANIGNDFAGIRGMDDDEERRNPNAHGLYDPVTKAGAIRRTCPVPAFAAVHEIAHHVLKKHPETIASINAALLANDADPGVGKGAYAAMRMALALDGGYDNKAIPEEIAVRAAAWTVAKYARSKQVRQDFLDISTKREYIGSDFSDFHNMDAVEKLLGKSIMKLSFIKKAMAKLGLADTKREKWREKDWGFEIKPEWTYADAFEEWARRVRAGEIKHYTF